MTAQIARFPHMHGQPARLAHTDALPRGYAGVITDTDTYYTQVDGTWVLNTALAPIPA